MECGIAQRFKFDLMSDDKRIKFLIDNILSLSQIEDSEKVRTLQTAVNKSKDVSNFLDDPRYTNKNSVRVASLI